MENEKENKKKNKPIQRMRELNWELSVFVNLSKKGKEFKNLVLTKSWKNLQGGYSSSSISFVKNEFHSLMRLLKKVKIK